MLAFAAQAAWSAEPTSAHDVHICAPDGVALGGFDVVSYRQADGPVQGDAMISWQHNGLIYRFANLDNRAAFVKEPQRYLPTYSGWCSTNLAMGRLACPDYTNFQIENDELLLFEHVGFTNGRDVWNTNPQAHKRRADGNFLRLLR